MGMDIDGHQRGKRYASRHLRAVPDSWIYPGFIHRLIEGSSPDGFNFLEGSVLFEKARFFGVYGRRLFSYESLVDPLEKNNKDSSGHDDQKAVDQKDAHMREAIIFFLS